MVSKVLTIGTTATTAAAGNHTHTASQISYTGGGLVIAPSGTLYDALITIDGNLDVMIYADDSRLTNARPPTAHKSSHATGGTDALTPADIGLGNVNNTSDASKPVSTAQQTALDAKAPLVSPALTGTPTAPTAATATNTTQVATTAHVKAVVAGYLPLAGGTLTGAISATSFAGSGSGLTALNASNISTGTIAAARLPSPIFVGGTNSVAVGTNPSPWTATQSLSAGQNNTQHGVNNTQSGSNNTQSGNYGTQSGSNNTQSGYNNTQSGSNNTQSGNYGTQSGYNNTQSGHYSTQHGSSNTQIGNHGTQHGNFANDFGLFAAITHSAGRFSAPGDAQKIELIARIETTDATPSEMFLDGNSQRITLRIDSTYYFRAKIAARRTDANNESAIYTLEGGIDCNTNAASTAIVGTVTKTVLAEDSVAWDVSATADTTNGTLKLTVTGEAAKTIRWVAWIELVQVTG